MEIKEKLVLCLIVLSLMFGGFLLWQNYQTNKLLNQHYVALLKVTPAALATQALGAQVYAQSQDLISAKLPDSNPFSGSASNAIDLSYKNPFQ